jgi:5-keto 4-deoxyuronate isomerase
LLKGTILNGGADYQMADSKTNRTEIEAIYSIKTDDGVYIHIRNKGIISNSQDAQGRPSFYFRCSPRFEAPNDSKYAWLNNAIFVCQPGFGGNDGTINLKIWKVK